MDVTQNFIRDPRTAERVVSLSSVGPDDVALDIGAGHGELTEPLAGRAREVQAIERDPRLAERLRQRFKNQANVRVIEADFLTARLPSTPYKVVSNIPFNRTADIIRRLTDSGSQASESLLVTQAAAAARFTGPPTGPPSMAATVLKPFFEASIVHRFARADFLPPPAVDVVLLRISRRDEPWLSGDEARDFRDIVTYAFTRRQPTLTQTLSAILTRRQIDRLQRELGFDRAATPTDLSIDQWIGLTRFIHDHPGQVDRRFEGAARSVRMRDERTFKIHRTRQATDWRPRS